MVQKLHWTSLYNTGIERLDSQHQWLMELINRALSALSRKDQTELSARSLMSLVEFAKQHFADEEALMQAGHYSELGSHKEHHDLHLRQLAREILNLNAGDQVNLDEFRDFLKSWLIPHILNEDKRAADFILKSAPHVLKDISAPGPRADAQKRAKPLPSH